MALVMNASCEAQHVKVFGNHFDFAPGQIKVMEEKVAQFLRTDRADRGFVDLPEEFADPSYKETPEGKKIFDEKREEGVQRRCQFLRQIIYNNEVSLRQDLERSNVKADPKVFASPGEIAAYEELVKYQRAKEDQSQVNAKRIAELQKQLKPGT